MKTESPSPLQSEPRPVSFKAGAPTIALIAPIMVLAVVLAEKAVIALLERFLLVLNW